MDDGPAIGARDLIVAIFRLAVADYLGTWYGHDEPGPMKRTNARFSSDAADFLGSSWAAYLADCAGLPARAIRLETDRLVTTRGISARLPTAA